MNNFAILVLSCDKYQDMWRPFFSRFHDAWPDCPFPVYLGSNTKNFPDRSIRTIRSGPGVDWSTDLLSLLGKMKEEYIFLWIDDFFPISYINPVRFLKGFKHLEKYGANHIQIAPLVSSISKSTNGIFFEYEKGMPYRINACGFWNKRHLERLLIPGENPWKFEIMGSYRASYFDGYYCYTQPLFEFIRVVDKGILSKNAFDWCARNGITLDVSRRPIESVYQKAKSDIMNRIFQTVLAIPWKTRVGTMEALRKVLASY